MGKRKNVEQDVQDNDEQQAKKKVKQNSDILFEIFKAGCKDREEAKRLLIEQQLELQGKESLADCQNSKGKTITEAHVEAQVTGWIRNLNNTNDPENVFHQKKWAGWEVVETETELKIVEKEQMGA